MRRTLTLVVAVVAGLGGADDAAADDPTVVESTTAAATIVAITPKSPLEIRADELSGKLRGLRPDDAVLTAWLERLAACTAGRAHDAALAGDSITNLDVALADMLRACAGELGSYLPGGNLGRYDAMNASARATDPAISLSCGSGVDPTLSEGANGDSLWSTFTNWLFGDGQQSPPPQPDDYKIDNRTFSHLYTTDYSTADKAAERLLQEAFRHDLAAADAARLGLPELAADYRATADQLRQLAGGFGAGQGGKTDPEAANTCSAAAEQIAECARSAWLSYDCQRLKGLLEGCKVSEVFDPSPDGEPPPCGQTEVSPEQVVRAVLTACEALVNYGPDGGSPCSSTVANAVLSADARELCTYEGRMIVCSDWVCTSEVAQPTPDQESCFGEAKVVSFGPDLAALLATAFAKLGGPLWTPPAPPPLPGGPDPGPGTSEGEPTPEGSLP